MCVLKTYINSLLILSAGRGIGLDGFHKLNIVSPSTGETILARYRRQLSDDITVVVGYRAPELMSHNPNLTFVYNYRWFETGSAFSASLGLKKVPVVVVPSDLFLDEAAAMAIRSATGNVIFTSDTENRPVSAVNVSVEGGLIADIYSGPKRRGSDLEFKGIIRIEDLSLLSALGASCEERGALALSDCLELHKESFRVVNIDGQITEINTTEQYMEFYRKDLDSANS